MTDEEIRAALQRYAETTRGRDELVRRALAAGITKQETHELSGIARTTINRIYAIYDRATEGNHAE